MVSSGATLALSLGLALASGGPLHPSQPPGGKDHPLRGGAGAAAAAPQAAGRGAIPAAKRLRREQLQPGMDLAGADLSHLDLSGLDLRGVNLYGANLESTDLSGADLTRADLRHARMSGCRLTGTRLALANPQNTLGMNLEGAQLHPFFQNDQKDLGSIRELQLPDPLFHPEQILVGSRGDLFLLQKGVRHFWAVTRTGTSLAIPRGDDGKLLTMTLDSKRRLWTFGTRGATFVQDSLLYLWNGNQKGLTGPLMGCELAGAGPGDAIWAVGAGKLHRVTPGSPRAGSQWRYTHRELNGCKVKSAALASDGQFLYSVHPDQDLLFIRDMKTQDLCRVSLEVGSRPEFMIPGPNGKIWLTQPGRNEITLLSRVDGGVRWDGILSLGPPESNLGLGQIVKGPDGNIWFTQNNPPAIGRVVVESGPDGASPVAQIRRFKLGAGAVPSALIDGGDGNLYFTLKGQALVGCIRALPLPAPVPGEEKAAEPESPAKVPAKPRSRLTDLERRELAFRQGLAAEPAPEPEPEPEPKPAFGSSAVADGAASASAAARPTQGAAPVPDPEAWLARQGLRWGWATLEHILDRHRFKADHAAQETQGQFDPAHSTREGLLSLLAAGLRNAGEIGRVIKRFDPEGRLHTPCRMPQLIGFFWRKDHWEATPWLDVVTQVDPGQAGQRIVTAYPVSPDRY